MNKSPSLLLSGCEAMGVFLDGRQTDQLIKYYEVLVEWNKVMNLTGITDFEEVMVKHFVDSLSIAKALNMKEVNSCIDVGTGAGFPGIPLKIAYPWISVTLLDSLKKRLTFLDEVISVLGLSEINTVHGRAEDAAKDPKYREQYDISVTRAVSRIATISEYCIPFVKKGGYFIPYKSGNMEQELFEGKKSIAVMGGKLERSETFYLPDTEMERSLPLIKKIKSTPGKYPRKAGLPAKEPII